MFHLCASPGRLQTVLCQFVFVSCSLYYIQAQLVVKYVRSKTNTSAQRSFNLLPIEGINANITLRGNLFNTSFFNVVDKADTSIRQRFRNRRRALIDMYTKTSSTIGSNGDIVWNGKLLDSKNSKDRTGFATIIQDAQGDMAGSFSTETASYTLLKLPNGKYEIRTVRWLDLQDIDVDESFIDEGGVLPPYFVGNVTPDAIITPKPSWIVSTDEKDSVFATSVASDGDGRNRQIQAKSQLTIDIMIAVTNRAMCEFIKLPFGCAYNSANSKPMETELNLRVKQTNNAFSTMAVPITLRIVKLVFLSVPFDPIPNSALLDTIRNDANYKKWRLESGADLVHFITGGELSNCGIAGYTTFESASSYKCLPFYSFTHELGHNFGCDHDRKNGIPSKTNLYGYGWQRQVTGSPFRTVMAYSCATMNCPRIPYFSTSQYTYKTYLMGDAKNDNIRVLRENAERVSKFMTRPASAPVIPPVRIPTRRQ